MGPAVENLWLRVRDWWSSQAEHLVYLFQPEPGIAIVPYQSYLRVWLSEMFLARDRAAAADRYPAVQASVRLSFAGRSGTVFSTLTQPPLGRDGPGVRRNIKLTELLPFSGGTVEIQAGLLDVAGVSDIKLALDVIGDFSSLLTPPLATIANLASTVAGGIDRIDDALEKAKRRPALILQDTLTAAPGGGLQPGYLVVIHAKATELPKDSLAVVGGSLQRDGQELTGYDYLVLRIETMAERDDWRFPEWDRLIGDAMAAQVAGQQPRYEQLRVELLSRIVTSADLTPADRRRVRKLVEDELDAFQLGAVGDDRPRTLADLVDVRGLPPALAVDELDPADLLS